MHLPFSPIARRQKNKARLDFENNKDQGAYVRPKIAPHGTNLAVVLGSIENIDLLPTAAMEKYHIKTKSPTTHRVREHSGLLVQDTEEGVSQLAVASAGTRNPSKIFNIFQRVENLENENRCLADKVKRHDDRIAILERKNQHLTEKTQQLAERTQQLTEKVQRRDDRIAILEGNVRVLQYEKGELERTVMDLMDQVYGDDHVRPE